MLGLGRTFAPLLLALAAALPAQASFTRGLEHLHSGKPGAIPAAIDEAQTELMDVAASAPEFPLALLELQKIRYQKRDWQTFFGGATYYRYRIHPETPLPEMILLESLALMRHCQFDAAERLIHQVPGDDRADELADLLYIQTQIPGNVTTQARGPRVQAFTRSPEWKIPTAVRKPVMDAVIHKFNDPHALRVYVRNLCDEVAVQP